MSFDQLNEARADLSIFFLLSSSDWVTINRKDRYAGEIFIEFTYFIAVRPLQLLFNSSSNPFLLSRARPHPLSSTLFFFVFRTRQGAPPPPKPPKPLPGGTLYGGPGRFEPSTSSTSSIRQSASVQNIQNLYIPPYASAGLAPPVNGGGPDEMGSRIRRESFGGVVSPTRRLGFARRSEWVERTRARS